MNPFIHDHFLLQTKTSQRLFQEFAAAESILDYHSHLPVEDLAANRQFKNLTEIWLEGDHYKWRAMRCNGIAEKYCTGAAAPFEKFLAWSKTVPHTLGNPLYHWTQLELKRYFDIEELLNEKTARSIWERANEKLASLSTHEILRKFKVAVVCTTDDPADDLSAHKKLLKSSLSTRVYPTFRPDKAFRLEDPTQYKEWLDRLAAVSGKNIESFPGFLSALEKRHDDFHQLGCRLSDHGLAFCPVDFCQESEAARIFEKARNAQVTTSLEQSQFASFMMEFLAQLDTKRNWTKQLHLGALRNNNTEMLKLLGRDTGFDSMGDFAQGERLSTFLDHLAQQGALPKTILYNLNPADNYLFSTMAGNFQDGKTMGKIQYGSGWWFMDQKEGIEWQLNALANTGLLSRFVGMVTDSRSFMSFPRHEYFRRVLCNKLGLEMEQGLLPNDLELVGEMVRNISFQNAKNFLF